MRCFRRELLFQYVTGIWYVIFTRASAYENLLKNLLRSSNFYIKQWNGFAIDLLFTLDSSLICSFETWPLWPRCQHRPTGSKPCAPILCRDIAMAHRVPPCWKRPWGSRRVAQSYQLKDKGNLYRHSEPVLTADCCGGRTRRPCRA